MNCGRLKFRLCLWGCIGLSYGFAAGAAFASARSLPPDAVLEDLLRGVENKYNHVKTLRLRFHEIYQQDRQVLREEAGTLYLRKTGQMRWEYENPEPKLFLTDGRRLTLYVPAENRVTETEMSQSDDLRNPLRFLLGGLRFRKEFEKVERVSDPPPLETGDIVIRAVPKQLEDRLEWVVFEVSPKFEIRRLVLKEPGGIQTEFRFQGEASGLELSPDLFRFHPPQGTEVIKQ